MSRLPHHRVDGPADGAPLILGPSLGTSSRVWDAQIGGLSRRRRTIRWDLPGHGGTPASLTAHDTTSVAELGGLVLALADHLDIDRFGYAGVSLGGAVGTWLAIHHPDRVERLAVICSSAHFGDPGPWHARAADVRANGLAALADGARARWFTDPGGVGAGPVAGLLVEDHRTADPRGYAACCDAIAGFDVRHDLGRVLAPTLVIAGREDRATPPAHARELADGIAGSTLVELAGAAHLAPVEQPERVLNALLDHFPDAADAHAADTHAAGMAVRRAVLGDAHVDRAVAATTPFTASFQDLITRYAWGEIWTRPGLDRRTRSCVTLTALIAHGHHDELAMHVRAARRNGLTEAEIGEVVLQSAIYCGVPAANAAFAIVGRVLAEDAADNAAESPATHATVIDEEQA